MTLLLAAEYERRKGLKLKTWAINQSKRKSIPQAPRDHVSLF
jgi:hypothetical protein